MIICNFAFQNGKLNEIASIYPFSLMHELWSIKNNHAIMT